VRYKTQLIFVSLPWGACHARRPLVRHRFWIYRHFRRPNADERVARERRARPVLRLSSRRRARGWTMSRGRCRGRRRRGAAPKLLVPKSENSCDKRTSYAWAETIRANPAPLGVGGCLRLSHGLYITALKRPRNDRPGYSAPTQPAHTQAGLTDAEHDFRSRRRGPRYGAVGVGEHAGTARPISRAPARACPIPSTSNGWRL